MKITFIITSLGSGGAERVISLLANNFIKTYEVSILLLSNDEIFYDFDKNISIQKLNLYAPTTSIYQKLTNNFIRIKKLKQAISDENPDILISFMTQTNILSIIASKLLSKKIIISERINYNFLQSKAWKFLRIITYRYTDALVVQSKYDKERYIFCSNTHIIFNPLKIKNIQSQQREQYILAVGRIDYQKGFDRLIEAYRLLDTSWKLLIAGEGIEKDKLQKLVLEYGLIDKVIFIGKQKNIEEYYVKASIFTLSSRMEGFPNVLVEAMGYGCASVAFDCLTGPGDIVEDGKNGFLVPDGNIEQFAIKIQKLIDNQNIRENFSKEAKNIVERLEVSKITEQWDKLIKEVICVE